jgi:hypothetical protein
VCVTHKHTHTTHTHTHTHTSWPNIRLALTMVPLRYHRLRYHRQCQSDVRPGTTHTHTHKHTHKHHGKPNIRLALTTVPLAPSADGKVVEVVHGAHHLCIFACVRECACVRAPASLLRSTRARQCVQRAHVSTHAYRPRQSPRNRFRPWVLSCIARHRPARSLCGVARPDYGHERRGADVSPSRVA